MNEDWYDKAIREVEESHEKGEITLKELRQEVRDINREMQDAADAAMNKSWSHVKRKGVSGINKSQSKPVNVLGAPYGSQKEAERKLGVGSGTVAYWVKKAPWKAKSITKSQYWEMKNGQANYRK